MIPQTILAVALSYGVGSIPAGLWLGLALRGVDIRQHGSRNIGATNTMRVLGKKLGALAFVFDVAKGVIAALLIARLSPWPYAALACGVAAIIGHTASVFIRFRGGKGVATSAGVFLSLCPIPTLIAAAVFAGTVAVTRMVSAGSCLAAVALVILVYAMPHDWVAAPTHQVPDSVVFRLLILIIALFVLFRHRGNLARIIRGQENRI